MARGPIPDRAADRPTADQVRPMIRAYYDKPGNECGGSLHIVLDDGNIEDGCIVFCRDWARERGDVDGERLAEMLLQMSRTQRKKVC